jgi:nucleoside-diphosphate kinase
MTLQRTLTIVKPDGVHQGVVGEIIKRFEAEGFKIAAMKMVRLTRQQAEGFYYVHRERPFFASLTKFMSSGPCVPMVLEGEDVIRRLRDVMGATDPAKAADGTIRRAFASSVERNVVHGSDSPESARFEISYFFGVLEICGSESDS